MKIIRKTIDVPHKVVVHYKKQAAKTATESAKSLMEKDVLLIAQGHKLVPKNANP